MSHAHAAIDSEPALLVERLAELFEAARPTPARSGRVRVDRRRVGALVRAINRATGSEVRRDWRGSVSVTAACPLAVVANEAREAVEHAHPLPFTDDVLLRSERAAELARSLRRAAA
jgi:hypothetical protein